MYIILLYGIEFVCSVLFAVSADVLFQSWSACLQHGKLDHNLLFASAIQPRAA